MRLYSVKLSFLVILIFSTIVVPVQSKAAVLPYSDAQAISYEKAIDLKILGLFANHPDDFELDRAPTRAEGAVMLVRLLGMEYQVKQGEYSHPFTDVPSWADKYVGYLYQSGIANGVSDSRFGSSSLMSAAQYATFVLRSMGYEDNIDFSYSNVLDKAAELRLLSASESKRLKSSSSFLRNDLVDISYNALNVRIKGSSQTLLEKLVDSDKAIFKPAAQILGLYPSDFSRHYGNVELFDPPSTKSGLAIKNKTELVRIITKALLNNDTSLNIDISEYEGNISVDIVSAFDISYDAAEEITSVDDFVKEWGRIYNSRHMKLEFIYRYDKKEYNSKRSKVRAAIDKARYIVAENISIDMPEFDKEKILHDNIVNNTKYYKGTQPNVMPAEDAYEEYGSLLFGYAVCKGYAETMKLLCDLSGIECMIVTGETVTDGKAVGHAWNIVKIDGEYYHVDVTNDDPLPTDGSQVQILTYSYFNLTDSEMMKKSTWDRTAYPACTSIANSYYYKYNKIADSREDLRKVLTQELEKRSPVIELKVTDYSKSTYSNLSDLIFRTNIVLRYYYTINDDLGIIRIFDIKYS
ncbi:MAG: hypothetical protein GX279_02815 [Clostridiaceae bacterium]|nr:hypothetical protein [Clostridiaceae bacterium]